MNERINDKIEEIKKFLKELSEIVPKSLEEYKKDFKTKAACERYAEKIIEATVDLTYLVIKEKKLTFPEDEDSSFAIISKQQIISKELSKKLIKAKGMRNFIAHQYGIIDDSKVYKSVKDEFNEDINEFINSIKLSLR